MGGPISAKSKRNVFDRRWAFLVNTASASPLVRPATRARLLRVAGCEVGNATVYPRCYFHTADVSIADGVILNHGVHVDNIARVTIGPQTGVGFYTRILTSDHVPGTPRQRMGDFTWKPVSIGAGCWLGAGCTVLAGVTIGDGCVIGAGSLVRDDVPPDTFWAGVPASQRALLPTDGPD